MNLSKSHQDRTFFPVIKQELQLNSSSIFTSFGSCFSTEIGNRLAAFGCPIFINSHGILFNPISILNAVQDIYHSRVYTLKDLEFHDEMYHSWNHHGSFSHPDADQVLDQINSRILEARDFIIKSNVFICTLGSAWVYYKIDEDIAVANCHKKPASGFKKALLSIDEISKALDKIFYFIRKLNPEINIIATISPVRYLKDGFIENQLSKAHLISALHEVLGRTNQACYFPSYEIMMDDLRDYRYVGVDLCHPNSLAIDYIFRYFIQSFYDNQGVAFFDEMGKYLSLKNHRLLHPETENAKKHIEFVRTLGLQLKKLYPNLDWNKL